MSFAASRTVNESFKIESQEVLSGLCRDLIDSYHPNAYWFVQKIAEFLHSVSSDEWEQLNRLRKRFLIRQLAQELADHNLGRLDGTICGDTRRKAVQLLETSLAE